MFVTEHAAPDLEDSGHERFSLRVLALVGVDERQVVHVNQGLWMLFAQHATRQFHDLHEQRFGLLERGQIPV